MSQHLLEPKANKSALANNEPASFGTKGEQKCVGELSNETILFQTKRRKSI